MNNKDSTIRELILERVFPELRYGEDPDIERYFDLRAQGRMMDALVIYRRRLIPRYPDNDKRVLLLKLYRTKAAAYPDFLKSLLYTRADHIINRIKTNIDTLLAPLSFISLKDTYAVLKAIEKVVRLLPENEEAARAMANNYAEYAKILNYKPNESEKLCFLLSEFYDQASIEENTPTDFIATSLALVEEKKRKNQEESKKNFFDLSKIEFDKSDIARIEIPNNLARDEDKVLAYCHKYWIRTEDPAFERIIWLYSKKYNTRHYEVFKTIKAGRRKKYPDDDILTMVSTSIASRYNYSVQGDIYMQAAWRSIKANLYGRLMQASASKQNADPNDTPIKAGKTESNRKRTQKLAQISKDNLIADNTAKTSLVRAPKPRPLSIPTIKHEDFPEIKPKGSISDKIKQLSGRGYDVYKDVFLAKLRLPIREVLLSRKIKSATVSREDINKAENLVYDYMESNYSNAFMDWPQSANRQTLLKLGFELESLDPIIENCYKKIS